MSADLEELFGQGEGQAQPRIRLVAILAASGVLLSILGLTCTTAPGGALVLISWLVIDKETSRVQSGYLSTDFQPVIDQARKWTYLCLVLVIGLFMVQLILLCQGFYEYFWGSILERLIPLLIDSTATPIQ
jgi:hypothetical protein